jgi:peptide/nickel transport system substrate-binding protein
LNTNAAPFGDIRAREAIYYATDTEAILAALFFDWYPPSQTFTGAGGLYHHEKVPGYREYDPEQARAIVDELGGIQVSIGTLRSSVAEQIITALQTQWRRVGIETSIYSYDLSTLIEQFRAGNWQVMLQAAGAYDPDTGAGASFRFRSDRPGSGVRDPVLDRILIEAASTFDHQSRDAAYLEAGKYISDNAYAPFLFAFSPAQLSSRNVIGPGLSTKIPPLLVNTAIMWQDVKIVPD